MTDAADQQSTTMSAASEPTGTAMFREAAEAGEAVANQLASTRQVKRIGETIRRRAPHLVFTCARGSSDHAATYAKYAIETLLGVPVASAAPSIASLYSKQLRAEGSLCIAISQSGRSPDLLASVESLKKSGAFVLALVNVTDAPLADLADDVLPLCAGPEVSVAATKSFIASLAALAQIVAAWHGDDRLADDIGTLPEGLAQSWDLDWSALTDALVDARDLYVVGRGVGLGVAQEAALKLKETSQLHAEAFSSAELVHGPMALVREQFPVLAFGQTDQTAATMRSSLAKLAEHGARVFATGIDADSAVTLPSLDAPPLLQPILQVQSFYRAANALAIARGIDPDHPPHLEKVTKTR